MVMHHATVEEGNDGETVFRAQITELALFFAVTSVANRMTAQHRLTAFAEIVLDQRNDRVQRFDLVGSVGFEQHSAPLSRRQHHHTH